MLESSSLIIFAGFPPTTTLSGTSFTTTAPAATILFFPMVTPLPIMALSPIHTFSSSVIGDDFPTGIALS